MGEQGRQTAVPIVTESVEIPRVECLRCGHRWTPRGLARGVLPVACPKCFSRGWNKPRTYQIAGKPAPTQRRQRQGTS